MNKQQRKAGELKKWKVTQPPLLREIKLVEGSFNRGTFNGKQFNGKTKFCVNPGNVTTENERKPKKKDQPERKASFTESLNVAPSKRKAAKPRRSKELKTPPIPTQENIPIPAVPNVSIPETSSSPPPMPSTDRSEISLPNTLPTPQVKSPQKLSKKRREKEKIDEVANDTNISYLPMINEIPNFILNWVLEK